MDQAFGFFGLGLWLGITGPLALHWGISFSAKVSRIGKPIPPTIKALERVTRFVMSPLLLVGVLGIASVIGQSHGSANFAAPGMFIGLAAYIAAAFLNRRAK